MEQQNQKQNFWDKLEIGLYGRNSEIEMKFVQKIKPYQLRIEFVLWGIAFVGFIMNYKHIPIALMILSISLILISILYFFLAFAKYDTDTKPNYNILNFFKYLLGWSKSTAVVGILYAFVKWPGADVMLTVGLITSGIVILVSLIFNLYGNKSEIFRISEIIRSFIILVLTLSAYYFLILH